MLLDAMGTLVRLDDPVGRLRAALESHTGADVGSDGAARALRAEIEADARSSANIPAGVAR